MRHRCGRLSLVLRGEGAGTTGREGGTIQTELDSLCFLKAVALLPLYRVMSCVPGCEKNLLICVNVRIISMLLTALKPCWSAQWPTVLITDDPFNYSYGFIMLAPFSFFSSLCLVRYVVHCWCTVDVVKLLKRYQVS